MQVFLSQIPDLFVDVLFQKGTAPITGVSTDSRHLQAGDLFIALVGENFDGHRFLPDILHKVSGIVCSKLPDVYLPEHLNIFLVPDTLIFYQDLARSYLKTKPDLIRIAITGSSGKTSTKEWLANILETQYRTYKNVGNFNNLVGVPKSALEVRDEQIAIFEMGSGKPGDIAILGDIVAPQWVIVTSIGEAHLEFFSTLEGIAKEKASLCKAERHCYMPKETPFAEDYFQNFRKVYPQALFSSIQPRGEDGFLLDLKSYVFSFPFPGNHNLSNLSLAITLALNLKISPANIASASFPPLPGYRAHSLMKEKSRLILDCYNANPTSMQASLQTVFTFDPPPILVLGDMLELGEKGPLLHLQLGKWLNAHPFPFIFFVGPLMQEAAKIYQYPHTWGSSLQDIRGELEPLFVEDKFFFVKGSRGMHLEDIMQW